MSYPHPSPHLRDLGLPDGMKSPSSNVPGLLPGNRSCLQALCTHSLAHLLPFSLSLAFSVSPCPSLCCSYFWGEETITLPSLWQALLP